MNVLLANLPPATWWIGFSVLGGLVGLFVRLVFARKSRERAVREEARAKTEGSRE
jgi:hypothetical protein